jgi:transposase
MFADQRIIASQQRHRLDSFIDDLNRRLKRATRARDRESIVSEVDRKLGSLSMRSIAKAELSGATDTGWRVEIVFDDDAWAKRRRYDGFVLLLADSGLNRSASEVVQLYRDKDAVERDFRTIKTDLKLRPVFHHSDPKVRAHVTLCMLSLLLERTMEQDLRATGKAATAPTVLETLQPCHLNLLAAGPGDLPGYVVTTPDDDHSRCSSGWA